MVYTVYMSKQEQKQGPAYHNLRARKETHRQLRLIAALTGESMIDVIGRLADAELRRLQEQQAQATDKK